MKNWKISLLIFNLFILNIYSTEVIGILEGQKEIILTAKSQGELEVIHIEEGKVVKKGEVIAELNSEKELLEKDMAYTNYLTSKKDFINNSKLKRFLASDEIRKKEDDYKNKKTQYELKEYLLKSKKFISPIDGIVSRQYIKLGENVSSGTKAFEVIQFEKLNIELDILASDAQKLKIGEELNFFTELNHEKFYSGEIYYISPAIDKSSGTVKVKLKLENVKDENGNYQLKPGSLVKVSLK